MLHTYFSLSTSILMKPRILTPGFALCSSFDDILEVMVSFFLLLRIFITCRDQSNHHHFELVKKLLYYIIVTSISEVFNDLRSLLQDQHHQNYLTTMFRTTLFQC